MQLCSPMLPVGAYAYSQGLEFAVSSDWVKDDNTSSIWIKGLLENSLTNLDIPILSRLHKAWSVNDKKNVLYWNDYLFASRDSGELQAEEVQLARALARLLGELGISEAVEWREKSGACFLTLFSLGAAHWKLPINDTSWGYLWMWAENQVLAAIKLVPLGQTSGQKILSSVIEIIPELVSTGLSLNDEDIGYTAPGQGIASALHETQYTRLFRS
ncbi:MAG: urease accessory protein UreF [Nitrospina sp.]|jgi:urease accessory protein|nr:urease accessory protein UreF [Nitrospina sp.]MBT3875484.1 urease accessory protein UreF [Nitrospina sp.]MBT4375698.1 urease accessory protein UreF [Nitrospina sp.]MBT4557723.1 urease accessory protein UreF [Nitrospina sp.]MBT6741261.1 urease accessory protein UreF [Nitrospina sp.]